MGANLETIYVTIPSCKEQFLEQTIRSALSAAANPERIRFGVLNSALSVDDLIDDPWFTENDEIDFIQLLTKSPMGNGLTRAISQVASRGVEYDYSFMIDAHMIFNKNWDVDYIESLNELEVLYGDKIVISNESDWWAPSSDGTRCLHRNNEEVVVDPYNFDVDVFENTYGEKIMSSTHRYFGSSTKHPCTEGGNTLQDNEHKEVFSLCANNTFSRYSIIDDALVDPRTTWNADEYDYAFRIMSLGYRIFAHGRPKILNMGKYGEYIENEPPKFLLEEDWRFHIDEAFLEASNRTDVDRRKKMITGEYTGYWGAPSKDKAVEVFEKLGVTELYESDNK